MFDERDEISHEYARSVDDIPVDRCDPRADR
jgi:hypothetical protein